MGGKSGAQLTEKSVCVHEIERESDCPSSKMSEQV